MYARKALVYVFALFGAASLVALGIGPLQQVNATPQTSIKVTNIAATPGNISPIDVLTVRTTVANEAKRVEGLTVRMVVFDEHGQPVLKEKQSGIGVDQDGTQAVYWVWRIPDRLADGKYDIEMTVLNGGQQVVATGTTDAAFTVQRTGNTLRASGR